MKIKLDAQRERKYSELVGGSIPTPPVRSSKFGSPKESAMKLASPPSTGSVSELGARLLDVKFGTRTITSLSNSEYSRGDFSHP